MINLINPTHCPICQNSLQKYGMSFLLCNCRNPPCLPKLPSFKYCTHSHVFEMYIDLEAGEKYLCLHVGETRKWMVEIRTRPTTNQVLAQGDCLDSYEVGIQLLKTAYDNL